MAEYSGPVIGKTYSLFGSEASPAGYYQTIGRLADEAIRQCPDIPHLIRRIDNAAGRKRLLWSMRRSSASTADAFLRTVMVLSRELLSPYTGRVNDHLRDLSLLKRWDRTLATSEEQYHLLMLLAELSNRAYGASFRKAQRKIAFLPYCLRDLSAACRSAPDGIDHVCKGCSRECFVNMVSTVLRASGVEPYIWMNVGLRRLLRQLRDSGQSLGVLGIACVPELLRGMKLCWNLDIPVVGIPLNANRCIRWMGAFHPTSVDIDALKRLLQK